MNDPELRAYLLGRLPEPDAERLEQRLLEDEEVFQTLRSVEDDLFDEHARDRLDASERQSFVERYGAETARLSFARALSKRSARANVVPFARRQWIPLAVAAALIVAVGGSLMTRETPQGGTPSGGPGRPAPAEPPVALTLTLGTSRSAVAASDVVLPLGAPALELRVRLDPADRFDVYSMELRSSSDQVVWSVADLPAASDSGEPALVATVPARLLASGAYELAVRGRHVDSSPEDLGFVTLKVRRNP